MWEAYSTVRGFFMRPFADAKLPQVTPAPFLLPCCPLGSAAMFSAMRCASVYGSRKICLVYGDTRRAADVNGGKAAENGDAADVRWGGGAGTDGRGAASSSQLLHPARRGNLDIAPATSYACLVLFVRTVYVRDGTICICAVQYPYAPLLQYHLYPSGAFYVRVPALTWRDASGRGQEEAAVKELAGLESQAAQAVQGWLELAKKRLLVRQALQLVRVHVMTTAPDLI